MIHPTTHIVAAATFAGCPDDVASAVAANVLHTAATRLAERMGGNQVQLLYLWAREINEMADAAPSGTTP